MSEVPERKRRQKTLHERWEAEGNPFVVLPRPLALEAELQAIEEGREYIDPEEAEIEAEEKAD